VRRVVQIKIQGGRYPEFLDAQTTSDPQRAALLPSRTMMLRSTVEIFPGFPT
jgi:hypothetical protein